MPFDQFIEPKAKILKALESSERPLSWKELKTKAEISQGALSKYLKSLIEKGEITTEIDDSKRPPRTLYSISETGMYEVKKIHAIDFLQRFENHYAFERTDKKDEMYAGFIMSLKPDASEEKKEGITREVEKGLDILMKFTFPMVKKSIFSDDMPRAAMVFFWDPEKGFKTQEK